MKNYSVEINKIIGCDVLLSYPKIIGIVTYCESN